MAQETNSENLNLGGNRYNRQELIEGWNQGKIKRARIAVLGSGTLANFTLSSLVSLGFGNVEMYDNAHQNGSDYGEFLLNLTAKNRFKVESLEKILSKVNPLVRVKGIDAKIDSLPLAQIMGTPDVIIDLSNDSKSQKNALEYGAAKNVPVLIAAADSVRGELYFRLPNTKSNEVNLGRYQNQKQGAIPSEVLGGIITEEVRKIVMPFNENDKPIDVLSYSLANTGRFNSDDNQKIDLASLKNKKVLVVGAGALGNFAGLGLALAGVGHIDILDFDTVETTNLNRQLLFYESVGDEKSRALAKKLQNINPNVKINGISGKLDESYVGYFREIKNRPDLILDCVDRFGTRAIINYFAVRYGIPLISGGTNPSAGQVVVYNPGESACLDCKLSVDKALGKERAAHSCIHAAEPSVIMTNGVIGGLMTAEAVSLLASESYGPHIKKMLRYDSRNPYRAGLVGGDAPCNCKRGPMKEWMKYVMKKAKADEKAENT